MLAARAAARASVAAAIKKAPVPQADEQLKRQLAAAEAEATQAKQLARDAPFLREQLQREFARLHEGVRPHLEDFNKLGPDDLVGKSDALVPKRQVWGGQSRVAPPVFSLVPRSEWTM